MKHSIKEDATYNREVPLPVKYDKTEVVDGGVTSEGEMRRFFARYYRDTELRME